MSTDKHPTIQAFHSALASFKRAVDERYPRLTPPAPRAPSPDEEDLVLSPPHVPGDLDEDLSAAAAISSRRP